MHCSRSISKPAEVVNLWRTGNIELILSPKILAEIKRVLGYERISRRIDLEEARRFLALLETFATVEIPDNEVTEVEDDPDDDKFMSLALASSAQCVISDNAHLLKMTSYQGIRIVTPKQFLENYP